MEYSFGVCVEGGGLYVSQTGPLSLGLGCRTKTKTQKAVKSLCTCLPVHAIVNVVT